MHFYDSESDVRIKFTDALSKTNIPTCSHFPRDYYLYTAMVMGGRLIEGSVPYAGPKSEVVALYSPSLSSRPAYRTSSSTMPCRSSPLTSLWVCLAPRYSTKSYAVQNASTAGAASVSPPSTFSSCAPYAYLLRPPSPSHTQTLVRELHSDTAAQEARHADPDVSLGLGRVMFISCWISPP